MSFLAAIGSTELKKVPSIYLIYKEALNFGGAILHR